MIVIDTSALVAILLGEPAAATLADAIQRHSPRLLSAASLVETSQVIESRKGEAGGRELDLLIYRAGIEIVPVDAVQAETARAAFRRFGTGRHPASLNFGDCFAYALAKVSESPLLFVGEDFAKTDLDRA